MKTVVIMPNPKKDEGLFVTAKVAEKLLSIGIRVFLNSEYNSLATAGVEYYDDLPKADLIIVIGGDGSVIAASAYAVSADIPILGVNLGKVGYLTEVEPDALFALDRLVSGEYFVEDKLLLSVEYKRGGEIISTESLAVNDVVISHNEFLGIADFKVENSLTV